MNDTFRLSPTISSGTDSGNKVFNNRLEGLRGLAALSVAAYHVFGLGHSLDPNFQPNVYWGYLQASHASVLLFFVISGYVIGLTNQAVFSRERVAGYFKRRIVRLLPIYLVAICLGLLIRPQVSLGNFIGNLLFLGNFDAYFHWSVLPLIGNAPVWSLNYEVVYYLAFLAIWFFRPNAVVIIVCAFLVCVGGWLYPEFPQFIAGYSVGWIFWLSGVLLSWKIVEKRTVSLPVPLLSYLFLFLATYHFSPGVLLLHSLGLQNPKAGFVNLSDLQFLPICLLLLMSATRRYITGWNWLRIFCYVFPLGSALIILAKGRVFESPRWISAAVFMLLAVALSKLKSSDNLFSIFAPIGRISYAFYLLHLPLLYFMHDYFPFQGTAFGFWLSLWLWLVMTIASSFLLEIVIQPVIKNWFGNRRKNVSSSDSLQEMSPP